MERPGRVFSREQLLDGVWGSDVYIDERTVDVHVGRLRKALNRGRDADPIRTVRGAGYALDDRFGKRELKGHRRRLDGASRPLRAGTPATHAGSRPHRERRVCRGGARRRLIGDARVIRAIGQAGERLAAAEEEVRLPGSPIGQRQVSSLSSSSVRRCPIGMMFSISSGSGSGS